MVCLISAGNNRERGTTVSTKVVVPFAAGEVGRTSAETLGSACVDRRPAARSNHGRCPVPPWDTSSNLRRDKPIHQLHLYLT